MMRMFTHDPDPGLDRLVLDLAKVMSVLVLPDAIQMVGAGALQGAAASPSLVSWCSMLGDSELALTDLAQCIVRAAAA